MKIVIIGDPVATMRPRCACINGKGHTYDHKTQKENMNRVRQLILQKWNEYFDYTYPENWRDNPILEDENAYCVNFNFYMPIAKSISSSEENLMLWGLKPCINKPDFDNLAKLYADCATGICWKDDKNITLGISNKVRYSKNPRVEMEIKLKPIPCLREKEKIIYKTFSPIELKEFCLQALKIGELYEKNQEYFEENENIPTEVFLSSLALYINNISSFADKLKKISK